MHAGCIEEGPIALFELLVWPYRGKLYASRVSTAVPRMKPWLHFMRPPLHVATLTVQRELPKYLCTKNVTMAPLHVATLTVQSELP